MMSRDAEGVNDVCRNHDERERKAGGAIFRCDQHGSVAAILGGRAWVQNDALVDSRSG